MAARILIICLLCARVAIGAGILSNGSLTTSGTHRNASVSVQPTNTTLGSSSNHSVIDQLRISHSAPSGTKTVMSTSDKAYMDLVACHPTSTSAHNDSGPSDFVTQTSSRWSGTGSIEINLTTNSTSYTAGILNSTTELAQTGSGFEYALSCNDLSQSWATTFFEWDRSVRHDPRYSIQRTVENTLTTTLYASTTAPTTATSCLGTSRELGGQVLAISSTGQLVESFTYTVSDYTQPPYPTPTPECSFDLADCNTLWDSYDAYTSHISTARNEDTVTLREISKPLCVESRPYRYCNACTIGASFADVHYWPLVAVGEPCDPDRSYTTAAPTIPGQPNTAVMGNTTFTSPTVYLSFQNLYATAAGGHYCGISLDNIVMGFEPDEISSIRFSLVAAQTWADAYTWDLGSTTEYETISGVYSSMVHTTLPFRFEDLMGAVPGAAYDAQLMRASDAALSRLTDPITDRNYRPWLAVPSKLRGVDPRWSTCELSFSGIGDPPKALSMASTIVKPAVPVSTTSYTSSTGPSPSAEPAGGPATRPVLPTMTVRSHTITTGAVRPTSQISAPRDPPSGGSLPSNDQPTDGVPASISRVVSIIAGLGSKSPQPDPMDLEKDHTTVTADPNGVIQNTITLGSEPNFEVQSGSIATVADQTLALGGSTATINSGETLRFKPASSEAQKTDQMLLTIEGKTVTAVYSGSSIVLNEGSTSLPLIPGQLVTFEGQPVSALPSSVGLLLAGSGIRLFDTASSRVSLSIDGQEATAIRLSDGSVLLVVGSRTITIPAGGVVVFGTVSIHALEGGAGIVVSHSSSQSLSGTELLASDIHDYRVSAKSSGRYVVMEAGGSTVTLRDGVTTEFDGHTISAARDGHYLVVDGSRTQSLESTTSLVIDSASGRESGDGAEVTGIEAASSAAVGVAHLGQNFGILVWVVSVLLALV